MAVLFDGVDDKLDVADEAAFDYEITDAFSVAAWIYRATAGGGTDIAAFVGKALDAVPSTGWAFNYQTNGGPTIDFHLIDGASNDIRAFGPDGAFTEARWVHVAATYDGSADVSGIKLYVGGAEVPTGGGSNANINSWTTGNILHDDPIRIGGFFNNEFFAGGVANVVLVKQELTAAQVALLADLSNLNTDPATLLGVSPDLWLPFTADAGVTTYDANDYSGGNHDVSVGGGAPVAMTDPAVEYDALSLLDLTTSDSVTHTPVVNQPRAVVVLIAQNAAATDRITGVTYGGVAMTRVATDGFAQDTAGEPGAVYAYFLGSGIPSGAQTVAITVSAGTEAKRALVMSFTATGDTEVAASGKVEGDAANPSASLSTPSGWVGTALAMCFSGQNASGSLARISGYAGLPSKDFGNQVAVAELGSKSGTPVASGWTATSEDVAMIAFAIRVKPTSMPADPGSYAVTGAAATLLATRLLAATAGSYAVTGAAASVLVGKLLSGDPGTYTITGQDTGLLKGWAVELTPGVYAVSGQDAALLTGLLLNAVPGVYVITGAAAELVTVGQVVLTADPGSYAVTGDQTGLTTGYLIVTDPGAYLVTGTDAALLAGLVVDATAGVYTVNGTPAALVIPGAVTVPGLVAGGDRPSPYTVAGGDRGTDVDVFGGDKESG